MRDTFDALNLALATRWPGARAGQGTDRGVLLGLLRMPIYRFLAARFRVRREPDAWLEDVTQDALLRVHIHFDACRAETTGAFLAWVMVIARTAALDALRVNNQDRAMLSSTDSEGIIVDAADEESAPPSSLAVRVVLAQAALPERDVELLWYRVIGNHSWHEVGDALGISWTAARRRFQRAQRLLRAIAERSVDSDD